MTRKQMKNLANEIYRCEAIHENPSSSKEEKVRAEKRLMQLTNQIMALKDGTNILMEIDVLVQELVSKKKLKGEI